MTKKLALVLTLLSGLTTGSERPHSVQSVKAGCRRRSNTFFSVSVAEMNMVFSHSSATVNHPVAHGTAGWLSGGD